MSAKKEEQKELTIDEHNAKIAAEIKKHEDAIAELRSKTKSYASMKMASLKECNEAARKSRSQELSLKQKAIEAALKAAGEVK